MRTMIICAALLFLACFAGAAYAEKYSFPANKVSQIDVVINDGVLNVRSADVDEVSVNVTPEKSKYAKRHIKLRRDSQLEIYLDDDANTPDSIIDITVPAKKMDMEINSKRAKVDTANLKGRLSIDTAKGPVVVENFNGALEIDTVYGEVYASGIFERLDIESDNAAVRVKLRELPGSYSYSIEGAGSIIFDLDSGIKKKKFKIKSDEFTGNLEVQ